MVDSDNIHAFLTANKLRVTPQRVAVYEAVMCLGNHPSAEDILDFVRIRYPNIALGTVYNTLETFLEKGIISRLQTDGDIMRYDVVKVRHHHLYSSNPIQIRDYFDEELNGYLEDYFRNRKIPGFRVDDIKVYIIGKFSADEKLKTDTDSK